MKVLKNTAWLLGAMAIVAACGDDSGSSGTTDGGAGETDTGGMGTDTGMETGGGTDSDTGAETAGGGETGTGTDTAGDTAGTDTAGTDTGGTDTGGDTGGGMEAGVPDGGVADGGPMGMEEAGTGPDAEVDSGPPPLPDPVPMMKVLVGEFSFLESYSAANFGDGGTMPDVMGKAQLVVNDDGTSVSIQVTGLEDGDYAAHVHALPCSINDGGGHYLLDPTSDPGEANELWPSFTSMDGVGTGSAWAEGHAARGDAQSIVVHDASGAKMLCADLGVFGDGTTLTLDGTFASLPDVSAADQGIAGTVQINISGSSIFGNLDATGLDSSATYGAYVSSLTCELGGGDPYVVDPEAADPSYLLLDVPNGDGFVFGTALRPDAESVVIHREEAATVDGGAPTLTKVACADLTRDYTERVTSGDSMLLPDGEGSDLAATATMTRSFDGNTTVMLEVEGAEAGSAHGAHVHNQPCAVDAGGGHYKDDPSIQETMERNEVWLDFEADDGGAAMVEVTVPYTLRVEAQSVVIHGDGGVRLACIDLMDMN